MKIGVLTTSFPRFSGDAAGPFVLGQCQDFVRRGHRVIVVCAGPSPPNDPGPVAEFEHPGITVHRVPSWLFYGGQGGAPEMLDSLGLPKVVLEGGRFVARYFALARSVLSEVDLLVSHWLVPCSLIGALLFRGRPHVAIAHSGDVHLLFRLGLLPIASALARSADLVYVAESLRIPGAWGRVAPMGIDTKAFAPPCSMALAREELGLTRPTWLFLGRLVPVKGLDLLLCALSRTQGVDLIIAGDGPLRLSLEQTAAPLVDRVRFVGPVSYERRALLLTAADGVVVPSLRLPSQRTEGSPTVILEALAAGRPVLGTQVGGIPELIGEAGWVVPEGDVEALSQALSVLHDPGEVAQRGALASVRATQFDWAVMGERLVPLLAGSQAEPQQK